MGLILGLGRSPGEGNGNSLQHSCLGNLMDREDWQATVRGGHKELDMSEHTHTHTHTHTLNKTIIELVTHGICCSSCFREVTSSFYYIVSVRVHRINKFLTTTVSVSAFLEFGFHYN